MSATVFISHSSRDNKVARTLCEALEQRGVSCWISSRDIGPGENFQEAIVRALRGARAMILVFTANANNSDEIKKEMALASQNKLAVIPVRVEDVIPSDAFAYEFATRQWVDAFGDWDRAVGRLADQVREFAGDGAAAPRPVAPPPPRARRRGIVVAIAIGIAILGAGAGLYLAYTIGGAGVDVSGDWVSPPLANPYDANEKSVVTLELHQRGETLFGTVSEAVEGRGGDKTGIRSGQIKDGTITFFTQGMTTGDGGEEHPYKETYHGLAKTAEIDFIRQNDLPTGGIPEKFVVKRK